DEKRLRAELEWVKRRYDSAQVSDAVFAVIRRLEVVKQQGLSEYAEASPLHGLRLKLERKADLRKGCCTNFAVVHADQGHAAELRCAVCGSHRGRLSKKAANWLLVVLAHFPAAKTDVHVTRDTPATSARGRTGQSQARDRGKQNE